MNAFFNLISRDVAVAHAQSGTIEYTLANTGNITIAPGNSGSTTIIAFYTGGTNQSVPLSCDPATLPSGASCSFSPSSVIPTHTGNSTLLSITVPSSTPYGVFNVTVNGTPLTSAPTIFGLIIGAKLAINPSAIASLSDTVGTSITIGVNITDAPSFGGFLVSVFYNRNVLQFQSLDYSSNVFGSDYFVLNECLDGQDVPGSGNACTDLSYQGVGIASLTLGTSSGNNYVVNGTLFKLTFSVISAGFSALHFVHQEIQTNIGTSLQSVGYDGYFTNKDCGSGNLCKPPIVSFYAPSKLVTNRAATFTGTAIPQNPNSNITAYHWTWQSGSDIHYYNSTPTGNLGTLTNATFIFYQIGQHIVTLEAIDNYTAYAYSTVSIAVIRIWTDLRIADLSADNTAGVTPGTTVHIVTTAINNGVNPENSTLRLRINNQNVTSVPVVNLAPGLESRLAYNWTTQGLTPRVYRIEVDLDEVKNATTGQILENDTSIINGRLVDLNNVRVMYIQLISAIPGGTGLFLGLTLPETFGLGIVLIAIVVFSAGLVRKSRTHPEPL